MVEGQLRDSTRSIPTFFYTTKTRVRSRYRPTSAESTQVRWGGRDGRRKLDSGLGYTQDYRSRWTHEDCVNPDSVSQQTEQPAGRKRTVGGRPAGDQIPDETAIHRESRWDIPRKRALFTSDGPDSTTSGSDTLESHPDRLPDVVVRWHR